MKVVIPFLLILAGLVGLIAMGVTQGGIPELQVGDLSSGEFDGKVVKVHGLLEKIQSDNRKASVVRCALFVPCALPCPRARKRPRRPTRRGRPFSFEAEVCRVCPPAHASLRAHCPNDANSATRRS